MPEVSRVIQDSIHVQPAMSWLNDMISRALAGGPVLVTLGRPKRSLDQNALLWAVLTEVSRQQPLCVNGQMVKASAEDWKVVFTAALKNERRFADGIDGGLVVLGESTSRMNKAKFSELLELIFAYVAEHGIKINPKTVTDYNEYREAQ